MSDITRSKINEETKKILKNYEEKGISKNKLFLKLRKKGICGSKSTFYACFRGMVPQLIELEKKGKRELCYPSGTSTILDQFKEKLKNAEILLNLLEKYHTVGDCFYLGEESKPPYLPKQMRDYISDIWEHIPSEDEFTLDIVDPRTMEQIDPTKYISAKKLKHKPLEFSHSYCLQARYDILINLPVFLTNYINHSRNNFSAYIKNECSKLVSPIIIKCYAILQHDYVYSKFYSNQLRNKFLDLSNPTFGFTTIYCCKSQIMFDIESEFLKILGRYYFIISLKFSKKMNLDSTIEQKIVSDFIRNFFFRSLILNNETTKQLEEELIRKQRMYNLEINPEETEKTKLLEQISNSLTGKLKHWLGSTLNDPIFVINYYFELFFTCGIFSILERKILSIEIDRKKKNFHKRRHSPIGILENIATKPEK